MKQWKNYFLFWQTGPEPRCVFCFLSLTSCILTSAPCGVHHTVLGQVHPITLCPFTALSILRILSNSRIYSPERQRSVLDAICWLCGMLRVGLNSLLLSKGTWLLFFFLFSSWGHSGLASTCLIKDVRFSNVSDLAVFIYMCALGGIWKFFPFCEKLGNRVCYMHSL